MASPNPATVENESSSMFAAKKQEASPRNTSPSSKRSLVPVRRNSQTAKNSPVEITITDFFDFMKVAYQVYEQLESPDESDPSSKVDWEELTRLTVIHHTLERERGLLDQVALSEPRARVSRSDSVLEGQRSDIVDKRFSSGEVDGFEAGCSKDFRQALTKPWRGRSNRKDSKVEMREAWTESNLKSKLNEVITEGILDSILPYLVGSRKPTKTMSVHQPIIKKATPSTVEIKKITSFGGFLTEADGVSSRDRLGRRKSSLTTDRHLTKSEGEVEIHVCDEVKGLKRDFRCSQRLLVSKMGYFADVTSGQRLEDMDISVHCDIQIFDWLMRWVKRDTILVADWPILDPSNVIPILVSASFLQMDPLLHDCLIYCHAHMNDIVKTSTNLACLSDTLLTRLAAMYTNTELESIRDRKDKVQSRLYCKMIASLAEPVPETLRGHYATLATLYKCTKCNKLLGRHIAEYVPCQPSSMRIDQRGNVISTHNRDVSWNLSEYIVWLYGELRSWRRVYWRLWGDCHFLKCTICDSYFPAYQMEWCCYHAEGAQFFTLDTGRAPLPIGRFACCGERAYRFEALTKNTGCQFREHLPRCVSDRESAVLAVYVMFREAIAARPPHLAFPERLTRLVARGYCSQSNGYSEMVEYWYPFLAEPNEDDRLQCKEVFWWEGVQLAPVRQTFGLLGKLYTGNTKFNPAAVAGCQLQASAPATNAPTTTASATPGLPRAPAGVLKVSGRDKGQLIATAIRDADLPDSMVELEATCGKKQGAGESAVNSDTDGGSDSDSSDESGSSDSSDLGSEESAPAKEPAKLKAAAKKTSALSKRRAYRIRGGRHWAASLSARSNQDHQRRYEERALRQMRTALARRTATALPPPAKQRTPASGVTAGVPSGGVYVRLEAEWRELHCPQTNARTRNTASAKLAGRSKIFK